MKWLKIYISSFRRFTQYSERSKRSEVWNFILMTVFIEIILYFLLPRWVGTIFHIIAIIVFVSLVVRRFHDLGKSAWFALTLIIPILNLLVLALLLFLKGAQQKNEYGDVVS